MAALFMRREEKLDEEQKEYLARLFATDAALADARRLAQGFGKMVRGLQGEKLEGWLEEAEASEAGAMKKFATGVKKDLCAVRAGLTESWSNGTVEGFISVHGWLQFVARAADRPSRTVCGPHGSWRGGPWVALLFEALVWLSLNPSLPLSPQEIAMPVVFTLKEPIQMARGARPCCAGHRAPQSCYRAYHMAL